MKPSKLPWACDAPLVQEWMRAIGDELKLVQEATTVSMVRDTEEIKHRAPPPPPPKTSVRQRRDVNSEDPIRLVMFLGHWGHT